MYEVPMLTHYQRSKFPAIVLNNGKIFSATLSNSLPTNSCSLGSRTRRRKLHALGQRVTCEYDSSRFDYRLLPYSTSTLLKPLCWCFPMHLRTWYSILSRSRAVYLTNYRKAFKVVERVYAENIIRAGAWMRTLAKLKSRRIEIIFDIPNTLQSL